MVLIVLLGLIYGGVWFELGEEMGSIEGREVWEGLIGMR